MPATRRPSTTKATTAKPDIDFTLRKIFNKSTFRPLQREVICATLSGQDVFLQAATSFGKSLCFQLPAIVDFGITIVISPLLALMKNQVSALREAGVHCATLNSTTSASEKKEILDDLKCGHPHLRLLYVTPEYTSLDSFRRTLQIIDSHRELSRITVDEAHVISEWGHDFRPAFKALRWFKEVFPHVPMICLTATATRRVREDVIMTLGLDVSKLKLYLMTTSRPNLHYEIRFKSDAEDHYDEFLGWIREVHARRKQGERANEIQAEGKRADNVAGIIYTLYRRDTEDLAARLSEDGIGAKPFHAGLPNDVKDDHLSGWVANKPGYDIIVATTAFGMGIDKGDVRFVVHWSLPKSFEGYYQEAGRAGRDGKASICIMYYSREDRDRATTMMSRDVTKKMMSNPNGVERPEDDPGLAGRAKSLTSLVEYCESTKQCRHAAIAKYFADSADPPCDFACDWCKDARGLVKRKDQGLASEEWCNTQRMNGTYAMDDYE